MVAERARREYHAEVRSLFYKLRNPVPSNLAHTKRMFHVTQPRNANRRKQLSNQSVATVKDKSKKKKKTGLVSILSQI